MPDHLSSKSAKTIVEDVCFRVNRQEYVHGFGDPAEHTALHGSNASSRYGEQGGGAGRSRRHVQGEGGEQNL